MSGPVNGSPGAGSDRARMAADALRDARHGEAWLEANGRDHELADRMRTATVTAWGRVLRYADDAAVLAEARVGLDEFQAQAFERELSRWSAALVEFGFLPNDLDAESLRVLAFHRLTELPDSARWSRHREHTRGGS